MRRREVLSVLGIIIIILAATILGLQLLPKSSSPLQSSTSSNGQSLATTTTTSKQQSSSSSSSSTTFETTSIPPPTTSTTFSTTTEQELTTSLSHISSPSSTTTSSLTFSTVTVNTTNSTVSSSVSPLYWSSIGPQPINNSGMQLSGRITSIAINSSDPSIIYVGAAQGGVWKSVDAGATWTPISDDESSLAIGTITVSPDGKTLYAGTGEPNLSGDSYYGAGLLKSSDGGSTWSLLASDIFAKSAISRIIVSPTNPDQILVLTTYASCCKQLASAGYPKYGFGMFLSMDGGTTWRQVLLPGEYSISDIAASLSNGNTIYAVAGDNSIWQSLDGGLTWNTRFQANISLPNYRVAIAPTILSNLIFVAYTDGPSVQILRYDLSQNTSRTLSSLPSYDCGGVESQCWYDMVLATDPSNPNIVYFGGVPLFRSSDGGSTWIDLTPPHADQHAIVFSPNSTSIFVGNDGGIWSSSNYGNNWIDLNSGLDITQFESIATSNGVIIGGTQDNGCLAYSGSPTWNEMSGGDGGWTGFDPANPNVMYCNYTHLDFQKSTDGGLTWNYATNGLNLNDGSLFYSTVAQDPNNAGTLYIGGTHIYKTTDFANTWTDVSGELSVGPISALAVSPSDSKIVYGGSESGSIVESLDGGSSWKTTSLGVYYPVSSIAVDPGNASIAYASLASAGNPILLATYNEGATWLILPTNGISNTSINVIKIHSPGTIYLGTDNGVYDSTDGGRTWTVAGAGLPNVAVFDIAFTASGSVVAATHGRGAWVLSSSIGSTSNSTTTTTVITSDSTSTVTLPSSSTNSIPTTNASQTSTTTQSSTSPSTSTSLSSQSSSTSGSSSALSSWFSILFFVACATFLEIKKRPARAIG